MLPRHQFFSIGHFKISDLDIIHSPRIGYVTPGMVALYINDGEFKDVDDEFFFWQKFSNVDSRPFGRRNS